MFRQKISVIFLIIMLLSTSLFSVMAKPASAAAWLTFDEVTHGILIANQTKEDVDETITEAFEKAIAAVVTSTSKVFLTMLAKKSAEMVFSGMTGQKPAIETSNWGDFLKDAGDAALGDFAAGMAEAINSGVGQATGYSLPPGFLCGGPSFNKTIVKSLKAPNIPVTTPRCNFKNMMNNWDLSDPENLSKMQIGFQLGGQEGANDVFTLLGTLATAKEEAAKAEALAEKERAANASNGAKAVIDPISKDIKTTSSLLGMKIETDIVDLPGTNFKIHAAPFYDAINVFSSTLLNKITQEYIIKGMVNLGDLKKTKNTGLQQLSEAVEGLLNEDGTGRGTGGNQEAGEILASEKISVSEELGSNESYDFLSELVTCPDDQVFAGLYNCAMSQSFRAALNKIVGEHLTLAEAVENGMVDPGWTMGYKSPAQSIEPNVNEGFPYSSLLKLRRARIIPVGWEIAARLARQNNEIKTLGELMDNYDDRGDDDICDPNDPNDSDSPYCNLVDPLWVLKGQDYNCRSTRYSQLFLPDAGSRFKYCADIQDCVVEDESGSKCKAYGYCTREENIWRLKGDACKEQFDTCDRYTNIVSSEILNILGNTIDYGTCNADNAGCRWYSLTKNENGNWDETQRVHFNNKITKPTCDSDALGCSKFYRLTNVVSPSLDITINSVDDVIQSIQAENEAEDGIFTSYYEYATVDDVYIAIDNSIPRDENPQFCSKEYVGCNEYTPSNHDPAITAIVSDLDRCPAECVGYDSFIQEPTFFEERKTGIDFIPPTAAVCGAQSVGCEQFTNLDKPSEGGENIEYYSYLRQCLPYGDGYSQTYFYWVGTESGYQLNRVSLVKIQAGQSLVPGDIGGEPPTYATGFTNYDLCNREIFESKEDPNCRELFDDSPQGYRWYRYMPMTVSSPNPSFYPEAVIPFEEDCHRYRKTLSGELVCRRDSVCNSNSAGWNANTKTCACSAGSITCTILENQDSCSPDLSCTRTGGEWLGGECRYMAIPAEGLLCDASQSGCKEYKGSTGRNVRNIISEGYEDEFVDTRWTSADPIEITTSAVQFGGHSLKFHHQIAYDLTEQCTLSSVCTERSGCQCVTDNSNVCLIPRDGITCQATYIDQGRSYVLKMLYKNEITKPTVIEAYIGSNPGTGTFIQSSQTMTKIGEVMTTNIDWEETSLGPISLTRQPLPGEEVKLYLNVYTLNDIDDIGSAYVDAANTFIDNLFFREERDSLYVIENSWGTPAVCETDPPLIGGTASVSMIGCQVYTDIRGKITSLKSFSNLCPSNKVGCEALVNTKNLDSPFETVFNLGDPAQITILADSVEYLINNEQYYCLESQKGCQELALPTLDTNDNVLECTLGNVCTDVDGCTCEVQKNKCKVAENELTCKIWDEYYYLNDPEVYDETLCKYEHLKCEIFAYDDTITYFKNPKDQVCVYERVPGTLPVEYAWFKKGEIDPDKTNPPECICEYAQVENSNPPTYAWFEKDEGIPNPETCTGLNIDDLVWVNDCPESQNGCTEFIEPSSCDWRQGYCFLDAACDNSYPSYDNNRNGCKCDNGLVQCYVDATSGNTTFCRSEYDWYNVRAQSNPANPLEQDELCYRDHYLDNTSLDRSSCNGIVDWENECVLLNDTGDDILTFTSMDLANGINTPIQAGGVEACNRDGNKNDPLRCDSNIVLKVIRDRTCSEWITCLSAMRRWDPGTRSIQEVCFASGRCVESDPDIPSRCLVWEDQVNAVPLDIDLYQSRDVTWIGREYDGHSVVGIYPIDLLRQRSEGYVQYGNPGDFSLTYMERAFAKTATCDIDNPLTTCQCASDLDCPGGSVCGDYNNLGEKRCLIPCNTDVNCLEIRGEELNPVDNLFAQPGSTSPACRKTMLPRYQGACANSTDCPGGAACISGQCMITCSLDSQCDSTDSAQDGICLDSECYQEQGFCYTDLGINGKTQSINKSCRGYPEEDSPIGYDSSIIEYVTNPNDENFGEPTSKEAELEAMNIGFTNNTADCSYQKVKWSNTVELYYDLITNDENSPPKEISAGDDVDPAKKMLSKFFYGWRGYCLEHDPNKKLFGNTNEKACITWWPIDIVRGEVDTLTTAWDSVWQAAPGREYYCVDTDTMEGRHVNPNAIWRVERGKGVACPTVSYLPNPDIIEYNYSCTRDSSKTTGTFNTRTIFCGSAVPGGWGGDPGTVGTWPSGDNPYLDYGWDNKLMYDEEALLVCKEWIKVQTADPLNPLIEQNRVWSTRIRAVKPTPDPATPTVKKENKGYIKYYPNGYIVNAGSNNLSMLTQNYGGGQSVTVSGGRTSWRKSGAGDLQMSVSPFGASCFVAGGCDVGISDDAVELLVEEVKTNYTFQKLDPNDSVSQCKRALMTVDYPFLDIVYLDTIAKVGRYGTHSASWSDYWGGAPYNIYDGEIAASSRESYNNPVVNRLTDLFAQTFGHWQWNGDSYAYMGDNVGNWDFTDTIKANNLSQIQLPYITKVELTDENILGQRELRYANGSPVRGITIEMRNFETLRGEKSYPVSLSFYAYNASGEQMPLREIIIDWGDESEPIVIEGFIKNHKQTCRRYCYNTVMDNMSSPIDWKPCLIDADCGADVTDHDIACVPYDFGDDPRACVQDTNDEPGSFIFTHVYNCPSNFALNYDITKGGCTFSPKVRVKDNWGYSTTARFSTNGELILVEP